MRGGGGRGEEKDWGCSLENVWVRELLQQLHLSHGLGGRESLVHL